MPDELEVEVEVSIGSEGTVSLISDLNIVEEENDQEICYFFKEEAEIYENYYFHKAVTQKQQICQRKLIQLMTIILRKTLKL